MTDTSRDRSAPDATRQAARRASRGIRRPRRLRSRTSPATGVTTLNFFQFKGEALEDFNEIIADFEAENPDIRVVQNQVADADTVIRTLLVKDKAPDVITLNANGGFGRLAQAGRLLRLLRTSRCSTRSTRPCRRSSPTSATTGTRSTASAT